MIGLYRSSCYGWSVVLVVSMAMPALTLWMSVTIPADRASAQPVNAATIARSAVPVQVTPPAPAADLPMQPARLDRYVGHFKINMTSAFTVARDGEWLFGRLTGQPKLRLIAVRDHEFVGERRAAPDGRGPGPQRAELPAHEPEFSRQDASATA
jgi:hypothetical protein